MVDCCKHCVWFDGACCHLLDDVSGKRFIEDPQDECCGDFEEK